MTEIGIIRRDKWQNRHRECRERGGLFREAMLLRLVLP